MVRTPYIDENGVKKGAWSTEEDDKLRAYIQRYGHWNWRELPKFAGLARCGKSCRLRWMNYLRPNIKRGNYTKEEEHLIIKLHEKLGNRWSAIAEKLPGRTDNEIKNYWNTYLKKHVQQHVTKAAKTTKKQGQKRKFNEKSQSHNELNNNNNESNRTKTGQLSVQILESCPLYPSSPSSNLSSQTFPSIDHDNSSSNSNSNSGSCSGLDSSLGTTNPCETRAEDFWNAPFTLGNYEDKMNEDDNDFRFLDAVSSPFTSYLENVDLSFLWLSEEEELLHST